MKISDWLTRATADAESRGLSELVPLLQTLARSTEALRAADEEFRHPATEVTETSATDYTENTDKSATDYTEHTDNAGR